MNQITGEPNDYDFGMEFDYSVWTAETEVTLCNVPWGNDYRDVIDDVAEVNRFIDDTVTEKFTFGNFANIRPHTPVKVPLPHNAVSGFNYVRVRNPQMPVNGDVQQDYFYFILDVKFEAPQTTSLILQLDAWTTYRNRIEVARAFVERGHIGIASRDAEADNGRRWLTVPEGFDTGTDYMLAKQTDIFNQQMGHVLITSATALDTDPGTVDSPKLNSSGGGYVQSYSTATETYAVKISEIRSYLSAMRSYPWVTNGIIKVTVVPNLESLGFVLEPVDRHNNYPPGQPGQSSYLRRIANTVVLKQFPFNLEGFRNSVISALPDRYKHLTKFCVSPYTFYEVTNLMGSTATFRPELFSTRQITQASVGVCLVPGGERLEFVTTGYNAPSSSVTGEDYDAAVVTSNFPNLPVVNDNAINALASTAHSRSAARSSAEWAQQLALAGAQNAYDGSALAAANELGNIGIVNELSKTLMAIDHGTQAKNNMTGALVNIGTGAGGGAVAGGWIGAGLGAVGGAAKSGMDSSRFSRQVEADRASNFYTAASSAAIGTRNYNTSTTINESNKGLADFAAKGNYEQAIAAMNASVQDTMLTQPGLSGGFGGEFFRVMANGFTFKHRLRMIDRANIERIGEHWLRYGYALRAFMKIPKSLLAMDKFTYWKMSEVYMSQARIPELYKRTIVGILEKGVTVWAKPEHIGTIDIADNTAKPNIRIER